MLKTPDILRSEFAKLSATEQGALLSRHNGKLIDVCFRDNTHSLRDRQSAASEVMVFLSSLPREIGVDSDTRLNDPAALPSRLLDHISISAIPEMDGIYWDASAPASWIDTESAIRDRLHDKMTQKFYKTEHPIELVLYLHSQVAPPANTGWIEALSAEAAARLPSSPFRCVWFYDGWSGNVYVLASRDRG